MPGRAGGVHEIVPDAQQTQALRLSHGSLRTGVQSSEEQVVYMVDGLAAEFDC